MDYEQIGQLAVKVERLRRQLEGARRQVTDGTLGFHSMRDQELALDVAIAELRAAIPDDAL